MVDPQNGKYDNLPHISPGNIESFTGQLYDNVKCVKDENLISGKFKFSSGDIIYGKINPQLGKYLYATFSGLTSADAYVLNAKNDVIQKYLYTIIQTRNFFEYSVSVSMRSGMPKINRDELNAYSFFAPVTDEQLKIGNCILKYDHLITLHQSKFFAHIFKAIDNSTLYWEQRKLGEIAIFNPKSKLPSTFEYIDLESVIGTEIVSHSTETINTAPSRAQRLAKKGDIFYQTVRPYQKNNYLFEKDRGNYVFSTGYAQLRPFVNERFLFYLIQNGNFVNMVLYNCTGTSYPAINSSDLRRIDVYLSRNSTEQKCIGNTIKTIDHLITLHQLEPYKLIFKAIAYRIIDYAKSKPLSSIK